MKIDRKYIDLQTYKEELKILREHNDDHILQSELEDCIKEIELASISLKNMKIKNKEPKKRINYNENKQSN